MNDFMSWLHSAKENSVIIAAEAHRRLVAIHPFVDGNGRTACILMNPLLMQFGYPPVIITMEQRKTYLNDCQDFYSLIAQSLDMYLDAACKSI